MLTALTAHHRLSLMSCHGTSWFTMGLSAEHCLL